MPEYGRFIEQQLKLQVYVIILAIDPHQSAFVRHAVGSLICMYFPTNSARLNPIYVLRRHFRRDATQCEPFGSTKELVEATLDFFERHNQTPEKVLYIIPDNP